MAVLPTERRRQPRRDMYVGATPLKAQQEQVDAHVAGAAGTRRSMPTLLAKCSCCEKAVSARGPR